MLGGREERHDLLAQPLAGCDRALMAHERELVLTLARDAELAAQDLGGLAHVEAAHVVGEAFGDPDAGREHVRPETREGRGLLEPVLRAHQALEPARVLEAVEQRDLAHGFCAAREHQARVTRADALGGARHRLHPRCAVAVHGGGRDGLGDAGAQRGHARHVRGLGRTRAVAEHDLVEPGGIQLLARQQLGDRHATQLVGRRLAEDRARLDKRRAHAAHDPARGLAHP